MVSYNGNGVRTLVRASMIAALYAGLTLALSPVSYGPVQFRISELLTVLPAISAPSVWGLAAGCFIANIFSPYGWVDMLFGTCATLSAALLSRLFRGVTFKGVPLLSFLMPVICNAVIIGAEITLFTEGADLLLFGWSALTVGLGEAAVCYGAGVPFWLLITKTKLKRFI